MKRKCGRPISLLKFCKTSNRHAHRHVGIASASALVTGISLRFQIKGEKLITY